MSSLSLGLIEGYRQELVVLIVPQMLLQHHLRRQAVPARDTRKAAKNMERRQVSLGVANDWWNTGWIPFAGNGGGDYYYCVDTAPADARTAGQVISYSHESGERGKLAD